jgi:probable biosynthetic protein (TIGR04098 family)
VKHQVTVTAGLQQLDIHTLSEDWALATGIDGVWAILSRSLGMPPSRWRDSQGERMYGAVMALRTRFDLVDVIREDDVIEVETELLAIRKPHSWSVTRFAVAGVVKAEVWLLTSFIKRSLRGSNKKFSKVRDLWTAEDFNGAVIDALLDHHHAAKSAPAEVAPALVHEVNRIQDFNIADFLYFKNFVRIAKAAEWRQNRGMPARLNETRSCFYFGNAEDGDEIHAHVGRDGDAAVTVLQDASGRRLFLSQAHCPRVEIALR